MKFSQRLLLFPVTCLLLLGCSKNEAQPNYEFPDPEEHSLIELSGSWKEQSELMEAFPEGIEIYRNTSSFNGKDLDAYCVVFDPADPQLEFKPVLASSTSRPTEIYKAEPGTKYAANNGGFFGPNISYSLVMTDGKIAAENIRALNRAFGESTATYYPTRWAFGISSNNEPQVSWVYHLGPDIDILFSYPAPSPNKLNSEPQPQPSVSFPEGGQRWKVADAIGGSPVLIKDGAVKITDAEELISIDNNTSRSRSAIGYTAEGNIVMLAVEGNNPNGGAGLSLKELADLMREMGCVEALNLDGGGSTFMLVNGEETIEPSLTSGERAVMSMIFLKKK